MELLHFGGIDWSNDNVKKRFVIIFISTVLIFCIVCILIKTSKRSENIEKQNTYELVEKNAYYNIYESISEFKYYYTIYNSLGEVLYNSQVISNYPNVIFLNDTVVEVNVSYGNSGFYKYFELNFNLISEDYTDILATNGELCVYVNYDNHNELIIKNIFDDSRYYKEVKFDTLLKLTSIEKVIFIDNDSKLDIFYYDENKLNLVEKISDL